MKRESRSTYAQLRALGSRCELVFAPWPQVRAATVVVAFYALFFTLFFAPVLAAGKLLAPGDGLNFHVPFFYAGRTLWQPLLWGGYPLAADPQVMTWYPVAALFSLVPRSYNAFVVSAYVIAAAGAHGYARALTRSGFAGLVCGLTYSLSGFMLAQQGHLSLVHTAAWAPLIFWSLEELRRTESARWYLVTGLSVACCGLAGHLQVFLYTLGLAGLYCLFIGWSPAAGRGRRLALVLSALALGVAATAVQLIPSAELTAHGLRERMTFEEFSSFALPPRHLVRLFFPYALGGSPGSFYGVPYFGQWGPPVGGWGPTELAVYVGLLPLALGLVGLSSGRRNRIVLFWAGAGALALLLATGDATPLARLVFRLPGYDKFRAPARHLFEFALGISVLAAYGAAAVRRGVATNSSVTRALILVACATLGGLFALFAAADALSAAARAHGVSGLTLLPWRNAATGVPLCVLAAASLALLFWRARADSLWRRALVIVALVCDLASFGWFYEWRYTSPDAALLAPPLATESFARELRATGQRLLPARGALTPRAGFPPNISALWNVPSASGYSALILARLSRLLEMSNDGAVSANWSNANERSLDLFAVRYVFAPRADASAVADPRVIGATTVGEAATDVKDDRSASARTGAAGVAWDAGDLGVVLGDGCNAAQESVEFELPRSFRASAVAVVSALACSADLRDETPVLRVLITDSQGNTRAQKLRAGRDTSEWAYDCADVRPTIAHHRASVFESHAVERGDSGRCEAHSYTTLLPLGDATEVKSLRLEWIGESHSMSVQKISLLDEETHRSTPVLAAERAPDQTRWRRNTETGAVVAYENLRARPRAWLAAETVALDTESVLQTIKSGRLPDGSAFDPARTALTEEVVTLPRKSDAPGENHPERSRARRSPNEASDQVRTYVEGTGGEAQITRASETNVSVRVRADADAFLVLNEVNYPGWGATVDGRAARIHQTDYVLRGVAIPAGEHMVEFTFAPRSLRAGAALSAFAFIMLAAIALWRVRQDKSQAL